MESYSYAIRQRKDARDPAQKERKRTFSKLPQDFLSESALVALAQKHWTMRKSYSGLKSVLSLWHTRLAVVRAKEALERPIGSFDHVYIITHILAEAPRWLGGNPDKAKFFIKATLGYIPSAEPVDEIPIHIRALLLETLADIVRKEGDKELELKYRIEIERLKKEIQ